MCEPALAGPGNRADVLIVSDLPLQGGIRITATQMAQAIAFVLRERGFRAGPLPGRVPVLRRLRRAHGALRRGEVRRERPRLRRASGRRGGHRHAELAVCGGGGPAAEPRAGRARADGLAAELLRRPDPVGARRRPGAAGGALSGRACAPISGCSPRTTCRARRSPSSPVTAAATPSSCSTTASRATGRCSRTASRRARSASACEWRAARAGTRGRRPTAALARRVAASGAEAVFVGGLLDTNAARVVRDLRAALGPEPDIMGPDGLMPLELLARQAGTAADGVLVSLAGVLMNGLPPAGVALGAALRRDAAGPSRGALERLRRPGRRGGARRAGGARTGPARRCSRPCSRRASATGCSATSRSSAAATSRRAR